MFLGVSITILPTDVLKDLNEKCIWSKNLKMLICCAFGLICQKCAMLNNFSVLFLDYGFHFLLAMLKQIHIQILLKKKASVGHCSKVAIICLIILCWFFFAGLQEYIEAVSFQYFIKTRSLISIEEINKQLVFTAEDREETTNMVKVFLFSCNIYLYGMVMQ